MAMKKWRSRIKECFWGKEKNEDARNGWIRRELAALPTGIKILDAGAGECKWKDTCRHLTYVSQDICQYEGSGNSVGLQTGIWDTSRIDIVSDIIDIPVGDGEFDAILCSEVLEHLPDPVLAIKELGRIAKSGGVLLLTAPFNSLTHFAPYHYCTGFNRYWYEKHLKENGWEIVETRSNGDYFSYIAQELGRLPSVVRNYTGRKAFLIKIWSLFLKIGLKRIMEHPNSSSELQCFGYFIKARKA